MKAKNLLADQFTSPFELYCIGIELGKNGSAINHVTIAKIMIDKLVFDCLSTSFKSVPSYLFFIKLNNPFNNFLKNG